MLQPLLDSSDRAGVWIDVLRRALLPNTSPVETDLLPGLYRGAYKHWWDPAGSGVPRTGGML
jgi:hypothetical protein